MYPRFQQEQAGFLPKRCTTEQIFILRNILEQANEWRAGLYEHFLNFEKTFDSVHRESLWNIMRSYGIPDKMVRERAGIYRHFECAVLGLGHEEGNSRQEKRDEVEFHNSAGGP